MTTATATETEPAPVDEMTLESNARIARMDAKSPVGRNDTPKPAATVVVPVAEVTTDTAGKAPAQADTPSTATPTTTAPDLSPFDEKHRSHFEKLPAETIAYLKEQVALSAKAKSIQAEFTRRTQEFSDSAEDRATLKAIMGDEEAVKALIEIRDRRAGKVAEAEADYDPLDPEQRKAHDEALVAKAKAATKAELTSEQQAQAAIVTERTEIANHVLGSLTTKGYAVEAIDAKFKRFGGYDGMKAMAQASGEVFSKEYVEAVLSEALPPVAPKADTPKPGAVVKSVASGASAVGRSAGGLTSITLPAFMREGKKPADLGQRMQESLAIVNDKRAARGLPPLSDD